MTNHSHLVLARLDFAENRVHFGGYDDQLGLDGALPHLLADTLFSAICHGWQQCYGTSQLEALLADFLSDTPPWRMSDGFPYEVGANGAIAYLPKPTGTFPSAIELDEPPSSDSVTKKKLKRLRFLRAKDIAPFLHRQFDTAQLDYYHDLWTDEAAAHVVVNRGIEETKPYRVQYLRFKECAGLWVVLAMSKPGVAYLSRLKEVLGMIGETTGIGGRKSTGAGRFTVTWSDEEPVAKAILDNLNSHSLSFQPDETRFQLLLSITNPNSTEVLKLKQPGEAMYQLIHRRGFHYSTDPRWPGLLKKKPVAMLMAGSLVKGGLQGRLLDVTPTPRSNWQPPHPLYRYGLGLTLGVLQHEK